MSNVKTGSRVGVVEDGAVCLGEVTGIEDGMVDIDFDDGDDGTYPITDVAGEGATGTMLVECERELRQYVRRAGGFRKEISVEVIARAKVLMEKLNRPKPEWDENIVVPGFRKP